jgi:hypothetical protein
MSFVSSFSFPCPELLTKPPLHYQLKDSSYTLPGTQIRFRNGNGGLKITDGKVVILAPEKGSSSGVWRDQSERRRACLPEVVISIAASLLQYFKWQSVAPRYEERLSVQTRAGVF